LEPRFKEVVKNKWNSYSVQGNSISKLKDKFKLLKADLKEWNHDVFGCLDIKKKWILKDIEALDIQDDNNNLEEDDKLKRMELISQLRVTDKKLDSLLKQKARVNWFKHGDSNSKYYHSVIICRRLRNEFKGLEVGNQWSEDPEVVRREAKKLFEERFVATQDFGVNFETVDSRLFRWRTTLGWSPKLQRKK